MRRECGVLPLPLGERVGVRGFETYRETLTLIPPPSQRERERTEFATGPATNSQTNGEE
jgi:hypothetical protein